MKSKVIGIIFFLLSNIAFSQSSVPDNFTFNMRDVYNVVGGVDLVRMFQNGNPDFFDPTYVGVKDRLTNWRNYQVSSEYPYVLTISVSSITASSATLNGQVVSAGDNPISSRGFQYSTSPMMIGYSEVSNTGGVGSFSIGVSSLTANTIYYFRAFATSISGTAYGEILQFMTTVITPTVPDVSSVGSVNIDESSTNLVGYINPYTNAPHVSERGFLVNLSSAGDPDISSYLFKITSDDGDGLFSKNATGLTASTDYRWRAYGINSVGTGYGETKSFKTNDSGPVGACPSVGDEYQGGIVAYVAQFGQILYVEGECHGIIISKTNLGITATVPWGTVPNKLTGAASFANASANNTNKIVSTYGDGYYAAKLCYDYVSDGYDDWYLPAQGTSRLVFSLPGLTPGTYWTSTENSLNVARTINTDLINGSSDKSGNSHYVRAIRYF